VRRPRERASPSASPQIAAHVLFLPRLAIVLVVMVAVLIDLGILGRGARDRHVRQYAVIRKTGPE
jgi:hypothetical protein